MDEGDGTGNENGNGNGSRNGSGDDESVDGTEARVTLSVAVSLDGSLASPDGGASWLDAFGPPGDDGDGGGGEGRGASRRSSRASTLS